MWRRSRLSLAEVFAAWKLLRRSHTQTHVAPLSDWMLRRREEKEEEVRKKKQKEEEGNRVRAAEDSGQAAAELHSASFHRLSAARLGSFPADPENIE